ncbi:MAG: hypothetical protein ACRDS0_31535 [Pseudonocardiaceae bacterium]
MSDGPRSLDEIGRTVDRHESEFVRKDVYLAEQRADRAAIKQLQDNDTSKTSSARTWLYGVALLLIGAVCGTIAQLLTAKGHG